MHLFRRSGGQRLDRRRECNTTNTFLWVAVLMIVILLTCFLASHGRLIGNYFWWDQRDTGNDFFHSIEYVRGRVPYEQFEALYPPLANLLFLIFYQLIPQDLDRPWPQTFEQSYEMVGQAGDLRTFQAPMLIFILFTALMCLVTMLLIMSALTNASREKAGVVALCMILCPGFTNAMERGNIIIMIVPLTLFFVCYRNSEKPVLRELSLICLAIAAGLKLYPAFFGVLLLRDKQYKRAARTVVYGILSVILPLFAFEEGLGGIGLWLKELFIFGTENQHQWIGTGFANILHRAAMMLRSVLGIGMDTGWFTLAGYLVAAALLGCCFFCHKRWEQVLCVVTAIIMFQSQGTYVYSLLLLPLTLLLREEAALTRANGIPYFLTLALTVNLPVFYVFYGTYPDVVLRQALSLLLALWCASRVVVNFKTTLRPASAEQE